MKPDWKDAPPWANYLAMDDNGLWRWHAQQPVIQEFYWHSGGRIAPANSSWRDSLEARPSAGREE